MLRHADSQLFWNDSVKKDWSILIVEDNVTLRNEDLLVDDLTIQESLCSDQDITLGACVASTFEFRMFNQGTDLKGKTLRVSLVVNNHDNNPIPIGEYTVDEDTIEEDERIRSIKAYDSLYTILEKDFAEWFNNLPSPTMTCRQFRDSFFTYAGITQETVNLINDAVPFTFKISNSSATQRQIEQENEIIDQRKKQAELGVVLYDYGDPLDLSTYDQSKKTIEETWTPVVIQPDDERSPAGSHWWKLVTEGEQEGGYVQAQEDHEIYWYVNYSQVQPQEGDNPHDLGWYAVATRGAHKGEMVPTQDITVQPGKIYYLQTKTPRAYFTYSRREYFNPAKLGWYKWDFSKEEYVEAVETEADISVNYYERTEHEIPKPSYKEVVPYVNDNPSEKSWYEYDGTNYNPSTDQTVNPSKVYYEKCLPENRGSAMLQLNPSVHTRENPHDEGWYEYIEAQDAYIKTPDTTVSQSKKYYINIWEINQNDQKDLIQDEIKGADLITAICEMNGCFGHIGRDGIFHYIKLKPIDFEGNGLYPSPDLYPDPNLYPAGQPVDWTIDRSKFETCEKQSHIVQKLDRLVICKEDGDAGYVYPENSLETGHNTYKITGNFIWYSFTDDKATLNTVGMNILTNGIAQISPYTPCEIDMMGNPCIEVGDSIKVITRLGTFYTYVIERTLTGSQRLKDSIKAQGNEKRKNENTLYDSVIELQGKSNVLSRNVDQTRSEIVNMGENMSSLIEQTAEHLKFEVSKEIQNVADGANAKYQSVIDQTAEMISMYVTKSLYDENKKEMELWKSGIDISYDNITAEVSHKVNETGGTESFSWELRSSGFILTAQGGYNLVTDYTATGDMVVVTPVGTENPYNEWWHEQVTGGYKLTTDQTVNPNKTYYKSRQNPHDLNWYELDITRNSYSLTPDTCIHDFKSYYTANSGTPKQIFVATSAGVQVDGFIKTTMLDVKNVASFGLLRAVDAKVDNLEVSGSVTASRVDALVAAFNTLNANVITTEKLRAATIRADHIEGGTLKSSCINVDTSTNGWFSGKVVNVTGEGSHLIADYSSLDLAYIDELRLPFTAASYLKPTWHEETINGTRYFILAYKPS